MDWDPQQYARYAGERGRPFVELLSRIGAEAPARVVDLGCGPGTLTALLARRWPAAVVEGIDSSPDMIASTAPLATDRLHFTLGDAAAYTGGADVVLSNALLQWVPDHGVLVRRWASALPPEGWLAFQVPGNFDALSHVLMRELAESARWRDRLDGVLRHGDAVGTPADYAELLQSAGLTVDVWETTYLHVLTGPDPVLEWVRGTGLRPVLAALSSEDQTHFVAEYSALLRSAYPAGEHGTLFAFRRIFAVGHAS